MNRRRSRTGRSGLPGRSITPRGVAATSLLALPLLALIATTTLPDALATSSPDLALSLSPGHPRALVAKADGLRTRLLALVLPQDIAARPSAEANELVAERAKKAEVAALRQEIRALATKALRHDPLNARAHALLGETSDDVETARAHMKAAVERSRREAHAALWLLSDAAQHRDIDATLRYGEILMRTRYELNPFVLSYLGQLGADDAARGKLVAWLAEPRNAQLRRTVLMSGPNFLLDPKTPLAIVNDLRAAGVAVGDDELQPYVSLLIAKGEVELAYYTWLQQLGPARAAKAGHVFNPDFEDDPSGLAFDWQLPPARNASAEFRRRDDDAGRALHLRFGAGRVELAGIAQVVMIPPGPHRLAFDYKGEINGKRGLRWQLTCLYPPQQVIAETEMLTGRAPRWRRLEAEFTIPRDVNCRAQRLALVHSARSASEQFVAGEAWFDRLQVTSPALGPAAKESP